MDILLIAAIFAYLLPTIICVSRGKVHGDAGVFLLNLLLGWTVVGWLVAFVWACSGKTRAEVREEERRHKEMLEAIAKHGSHPGELRN